MLSNIIYELVITEDNNHYIEFEDNYFKINYNSFLLLSMIKQNHTIDEIASSLNVEITEIDHAIVQIKETLTRHKKPQKIKKLFTLLNNHCCNYLGNKLGFLFNKSILYCMVLFSVFSTLLYFFLSVKFSLFSIQIGFSGYLIALMIIIFCHELGHVCAASNYHLNDLRISFGAYYIWPVFYVALNKQVLLPRDKRIIVSAGGLYFQMLLNTFCIGLNLLSQKDFLLLVIHLNMVIFLINMAPILIMDGYWIYADLCKIENLDTRAKALLKTPISKIKYLKDIPITLWAFTVVRLVTYIILYSMVLYYLISRAIFFPDIFYALQENINIGVILRLLSLVLPYVIFLTYLYKIIIWKTIKK